MKMSGILRVLALAALAALPARANIPLDDSFHPALPQIPDATFRLTDFGAVGDGKTMNTEAFARAIAQVNKAGGGHLEVPPGVYRTLSFALCSSLDLHLDEGAVIEAPDTFAGYGLPDPSTLKTQDELNRRMPAPKPIITGELLHDVAITGPGTIRGNGRIWWDWSERAARGKPGRLVVKRFHMVVLNECVRIHIADVTLTDSPMFHLVPSNITNLVVEHVKVIAPSTAPNTDGIDPGPVANALIRDCDLDTGDDDIAIKTGAQNVLIEDCRVLHGHGISIGSGTTRGVHNVLVRRCTFDGADNGIRIKSMRGAGGPVDAVTYQEIVMNNVKNAIVLQLNYTDSNRPNFKGDPSRVPSIRNITIENVVIRRSERAGEIIGLPDSKIRDIFMRNVRIEAEKDLKVEDAEHLVFDNVTGH
jgi:polygalacturonase